MWLFLSRVGPIDSRLTQRGSGGRGMNGRKVIVASRFEDEDRGFRVFGQTVSKDTPRRTCSNDNIVVHVRFLSHPSILTHRYSPALKKACQLLVRITRKSDCYATLLISSVV